MLASRGPTTITFRGRSISREQGFVHPEDIVCPDGHSMRSSIAIVGELGLTCTHKSAEGSKMCGAMLYIVLLPAPKRESLFFVADVEYHELVRWQEDRYTLEDVFRYLGVWFTRGDIRARRRRMT